VNSCAESSIASIANPSDVFGSESKRVVLRSAKCLPRAWSNATCSLARSQVVVTNPALRDRKEIVTDAASVAQAFEAIEEQAGTVTVVVNNAGVAGGKAALELTEDDWDRILDTNLKGAWTVAQEAAKRMAAAETGGVIVNIASVLGLRVGKGVLPYAVSKAGLVQMTKALALELAPQNIRVNALAPGFVETDLNREYLASEHGQKQLKRIPFRRPGTMEELSGPLLLLCSDASAYMTGAILAVDGGHLVSSL